MLLAPARDFIGCKATNILGQSVGFSNSAMGGSLGHVGCRVGAMCTHIAGGEHRAEGPGSVSGRRIVLIEVYV